MLLLKRIFSVDNTLLLLDVYVIVEVHISKKFGGTFH